MENIYLLILRAVSGCKFITFSALFNAFLNSLNNRKCENVSVMAEYFP